jgi:hypothetical protein
MKKIFCKEWLSIPTVNDGAFRHLGKIIINVVIFTKGEKNEYW